MNDMLKNMLVWIVIAVVIMSVFNNFIPQKESSTNLSYSEFINQVKSSQIRSVVIEADGKTISGTYNNGTTFVTYGLNDPKLVDDLLSNNIEILTEPPAKPSLFLQILIQWFPMLLLIGVWLFFMRQMQGGGGGKGGAMSLSVNNLDTDFVVVHDADLEYNPSDLIEMFNCNEDLKLLL